jgi:hypothetical protein
MDTTVELLGSRKPTLQDEVDPLQGLREFGTIGYDKYLSFLLDGEDDGVELEMAA